MRGRARVRKRRIDAFSTPDVIRSLRVGNDHLSDWLSDEEFAELADVMKEQGIEAADSQTLLQRAWARRSRREPRKIFVGLLYAEGREDEAEMELRRRRAWGLDRGS
jgi:hypothetical protein